MIQININIKLFNQTIVNNSKYYNTK